MLQVSKLEPDAKSHDFSLGKQGQANTERETEAQTSVATWLNDIVETIRSSSEHLRVSAY